MAQREKDRARKPVLWLAIATGVMLGLIGVRFLVSPGPAAFFFGIDKNAPGFAPHAAIGLRDLWLGALLVVFAVLRDWRAVALWLGLAMLVCFSDSLIAATSSGRMWSVVFHVASGVFCGVLAWFAWRLAAYRTTP